LTAIFGGTELNLHEATVTVPQARIEATVMFGIPFVVPGEWTVRSAVVPVSSGASDDRPRRAVDADHIDIVVTGFAAFGQVSISN
jgi:hypothetical protein